MNEPAPTLMLSLVIPAFNEAGNLRELHAQLTKAMSEVCVDYEIIIVDDHSSDQTFSELSGISKNDQRVRGVRLSRNCGSHKAIQCGLRLARGSAALVMAADLQDPPGTISGMMEQWRRGSQIVWAVRSTAQGGAGVGFTSRMYYWLMRHVFGMKEMPGSGADFFLLDRKVIEALKEYRESNASVIGLLMWMGFRQSRIYYEKQPRRAGKSGWTIGKKIKLLVDTVTSFSYLPIRVMSVTGFVVAMSGFVYAFVVLVNFLLGRPSQGWSSLMMVMLVIGGMQMLMLGVLGEYLWRSLDESRRRPLYVVEADTNEHSI